MKRNIKSIVFTSALLTLYPFMQSNIFAKTKNNFLDIITKTGKATAGTVLEAFNVFVETKLLPPFKGFDFSSFEKYIQTAKTINVPLDEKIKSTTSSLDTQLESSLIANIQKVESEYNKVMQVIKPLNLQNYADVAISTKNKIEIIKSICNSCKFSLESITYNVKDLTRVSLKNTPYTFGYAFELIHVSQYFKRTFWYTDKEKKSAEIIMNDISEMIYVLQELDDFLGRESWLYNVTLSTLCTTLMSELRSCRDEIAPHNSVIQDVYALSKKPVPVWLSAAQELKKF